MASMRASILKIAVRDPLRVAPPYTTPATSIVLHACLTLAPHHISFEATSNSGRSLAVSLEKHCAITYSMLCSRPLGAAASKFQAYPEWWMQLGGRGDGGRSRSCLLLYRGYI
jgi:hypothetical protein